MVKVAIALAEGLAVAGFSASQLEIVQISDR